MADPSIILDTEPDWEDEPSVSYAFSTVVQDTPYFVEQRRPLFLSVTRSMEYQFAGNGSDQQRLRNVLLAANSELMCAPIFTEPIFSSSIVTGGSSITASTDLTYLWNIKNCAYVVLIDLLSGQSEMLAVTSVTGQLIRFATNIVKTWVAARAVIYPAVAAFLKSIKESNSTDTAASIQVELEETKLGSESESEWAGLESRVCPSVNTVVVPINSGLDDVVYNDTNYSIATYSPLLCVGCSTSYWYTFLRFNSIMLNQGITISTAVLSLQCFSVGTSGRTVSGTLKGVASDNAPRISTVGEVSALVYTSAAVNFSGVSESIETGQVYSFPDIKTIIQEIINRPGWVIGNSIMIGIVNTNGSEGNGFWNFVGFENLTGYAKPKLDIAWTPY